MSEVYSSTERAFIFIGLYFGALIASFVYLYCRIDFKQTSKVVFMICVLYSSVFIYLNIIAMLDYCFNGVKGFEKFMKFITKFYYCFDIADKISGFFVFPIWISFLESGQHSIILKLLDIFIRYYKGIIKMSPCQIIVKIIANLLFYGGILVILIIYKEHYELGKNPFDYIFILLDCYSLFEIYTCVGFFMMQIFFDCNRRKNRELIDRYYRYSKIKIIEKAQKYVNQITKSHKELENAIKSLDKNASSSYIKYINHKYQKAKEKMNLYELEGKDDPVNNNKINNNNIQVINPIFNETDLGINKENEEPNYIKNANKINNNLKPNIPQQQETFNKLKIKGIPAQKIEVKTKEKDEKTDVPTSIRKFKKAVRRINKLKKLYQEIENEREKLTDEYIKKNNLPDNQKKCKCGCFAWLFVPFAIVIITDFILPIALYSGEDFSTEDEEFKKEESIAQLGVAMVLSFFVAALCSSYTIITIYATTRRQYISGDFLYDKKISDNLSLLKTVQIICGYSFAILYCNLYFWKTVNPSRTPDFYGEIIIPDYIFKQGISVIMVLKVIVIIGSIIASLCFSDFFVFKNDLAEYDLSRSNSKYDFDTEFHKMSKDEEKKKVINILINKNINF